MKEKWAIARPLILLPVMAAMSMAQMGGMMGGGSLGGMMSGSLAGMMGGGSGLTIGSDGTLYITRSTISQAQGQLSQTNTQLAAIDTSGKPKWSLSIDAASASQPVLGQDGTLFLTTSDWSNWMYNWLYSRAAPAADTTANLLIVQPGPSSATVALTVPLAGQVASAPQIATDGDGGYVVYVVTLDAFHRNWFDDDTTSGSYLYAFSPAGALKYRLQLSQGGTGMMGF